MRKIQGPRPRVAQTDVLALLKREARPMTTAEVAAKFNAAPAYIGSMLSSMAKYGICRRELQSYNGERNWITKALWSAGP